MGLAYSPPGDERRLQARQESSAAPTRVIRWGLFNVTTVARRFPVRGLAYQVALRPSVGLGHVRCRRRVNAGVVSQIQRQQVLGQRVRVWWARGRY